MLQLGKRTNQGRRAMCLSVGQPKLLSRGRCLMTKTCGSSCEYICSCLHMKWSLHKFQSLKSNALVKRIIESKAAYFQSLFYRSYFTCCSRRHVTEKAERVKWKKKIEGIRLEEKEWLPFYILLVHFSFGRIMKIDYSTISS